MKNADDAGILSATTVLAKFLGQPTLVMGTHEQSKVTFLYMKAPSLRALSGGPRRPK